MIRIVGLGPQMSPREGLAQHRGERGRPARVPALARSEHLRVGGAPPPRRSSQRELAGTSRVGNISKGIKAHGRTGGLGASDGAEALRTRRRSKASKVQAPPSRFGAAGAEHALKRRLGNGAERRGRWPRDPTRPRKWDERALHTTSCCRRCLAPVGAGGFGLPNGCGRRRPSGRRAREGPCSATRRRSRVGLWVRVPHVTREWTSRETGEVEVSCPARPTTDQVELVRVEGSPARSPGARRDGDRAVVRTSVRAASPSGAAEASAGGRERLRSFQSGPPRRHAPRGGYLVRRVDPAGGRSHQPRAGGGSRDSERVGTTAALVAVPASAGQSRRRKRRAFRDGGRLGGHTPVGSQVGSPDSAGSGTARPGAVRAG